MISINETKLKLKIKKKNILIISSDYDEICKHTILNKLSEHNKLIRNKKLKDDEIKIEFIYDKKIFNIKLMESSGYEPNTHIISNELSSNIYLK